MSQPAHIKYLLESSKKNTYFGLVNLYKRLLYLWVSSGNFLICIYIDSFKEVLQTDFLNAVFVHINIHILNNKSVSVCIIENKDTLN